MAKGYSGDYECCAYENKKNIFVDKLDEFFDKHKMGMCSEEENWCSSDDVRDHYEIAEFFE